MLNNFSVLTWGCKFQTFGSPSTISPGGYSTVYLSVMGCLVSAGILATHSILLLEFSDTVPNGNRTGTLTFFTCG